MAGEHIIYLTSTGSKDLFKENNPGRFINSLSTPIILDSNVEYEVGLVSILYPDQYYAVLANDDNYNIEVVYVRQGVDPENFIKTDVLTIKLSKNILAGKIKKIIRVVNENFLQHAKSHFHEYFSKIFSENAGIFKWNEDERKVEIVCKDGDIEDPTIGGFMNVSIKIMPGLASVIGFHPYVNYDVFSVNGCGGNHKSIIPPSPRCGVDYIYLYTDIIQPTNFGGQLVNILDCFTFQNGGNKGIHNTIYKALNTSYIDRISIIITDQNGRDVHFAEESTLTCVLHIRAK